MKIAVIGTGYVGLVTGVSLALLGHNVVCIGREKFKIEKINKGTSPFYEPGLDNLLKKVKFTSNDFEIGQIMNDAKL